VCGNQSVNESELLPKFNNPENQPNSSLEKLSLDFINIDHLENQTEHVSFSDFENVCFVCSTFFETSTTCTGHCLKLQF